MPNRPNAWHGPRLAEVSPQHTPGRRQARELEGEAVPNRPSAWHSQRLAEVSPSSIRLANAKPVSWRVRLPVRRRRIRVGGCRTAECLQGVALYMRSVVRNSDSDSNSDLFFRVT